MVEVVEDLPRSQPVSLISLKHAMEGEPGARLPCQHGGRVGETRARAQKRWGRGEIEGRPPVLDLGGACEADG